MPLHWPMVPRLLLCPALSPDSSGTNTQAHSTHVGSALFLSMLRNTEEGTGEYGASSGEGSFSLLPVGHGEKLGPHPEPGATVLKKPATGPATELGQHNCSSLELQGGLSRHAACGAGIVGDPPSQSYLCQVSHPRALYSSLPEELIFWGLCSFHTPWKPLSYVLGTTRKL